MDLKMKFEKKRKGKKQHDPATLLALAAQPSFPRRPTASPLPLSF
jgi:hypothetical protein